MKPFKKKIICRNHFLIEVSKVRLLGRIQQKMAAVDKCEQIQGGKGFLLDHIHWSSNIRLLSIDCTRHLIEFQLFGASSWILLRIIPLIMGPWCLEMNSMHDSEPNFTSFGCVVLHKLFKKNPFMAI